LAQKPTTVLGQKMALPSLSPWVWVPVAGAIVVLGFVVSKLWFGYGTSTSPCNWVDAFTQSRCLSPKKLHWLRMVWAMLFIAVLTHDLWEYWCDGYWLIYLTHWSFAVETLYMCCLALASFTARKSRNEGEADKAASESGVVDVPNVPEPLCVKIFMVLQAIELPISIIVSIVVWTALTPFWKVCIFGSTPDCQNPTLESLLVHLFNTILIFIMFLDGSVPYYKQNAGWVMAFAIVYGIFTIVHYFLKLGTYSGCDGKYPKDECPIYSIIDWHEPVAAKTLIIIGALTFVVAPVVICMYVCIGALRNARRALDVVKA